MNNLTHKLQNLARRKRRVRSTVSGTSERPRLSIHVSNTHITAQIIDDTKHTTLAYATTVGQKSATGTMTARAEWVGHDIAKKAKTAKITKVVFDRGGRIYHGRIKALADAARQSGLEF
ncbi:MAG: 50S ribosomal protein L18 [Candidatus Saccharimonadales bacterium]